MIYFEQRDGKNWTSSMTKEVGPGSYQVKDNIKKECHNHGIVPFGVCSERFKSELAMKFEALPGPGHYEQKQNDRKRFSQTRIMKTYSERNTSRSSSKIFTNDHHDQSLASTVDNSKLRMFSTERTTASTTQPIGETKKRLLGTRRKVKSEYGKGVNSIPFKREEDNIQGIGPGTYNPKAETIHKKAPTTKIMKSSLLDERSKNDVFQNFLKNVIKMKSSNGLRNAKEISLSEQISNHRLNLENAVFSSKTSRNLKISENPGPDAYNATFDYKFTRNNPENFGSNVKRTYIANRDVIGSPFTDPTNIQNPGVGTYHKNPKYMKSCSKAKLLKTTNR